MADITLNFVNSYRDPRNGTMRHQFRRKGCRKIMLKGRPGSAEFMDHYAELLAQSENAAAQIGASKIKPGSIDALIVKYLQSRHLHQGTGQGDTGMRGVRSSTIFASARHRAVTAMARTASHHPAARTSPTRSQARRRSCRRSG